MNLREAIDIINYNKYSTEDEQLEAEKLFWKELFKVDVQNMDGTYKSMYDIMKEASKNLNSKMVNYVKTIESKEAKHPTNIVYIPIPDSEPYCYYCNNVYEDESCDGNWCLHCSCPVDKDCTMVSPWHSCDKFCSRK